MSCQPRQLFDANRPDVRHPHGNSDNNLVRSSLLFGLAEDVDGPPGLVGDVGNVKSARLLLADALDLFKVFLGQLNFLEVFLDARCGDRFGNDTVSTDLSPCEDNLCGGGAVGLCNLLDGVVLDEEGLVEHVVSECLEFISSDNLNQSTQWLTE